LADDFISDDTGLISCSKARIKVFARCFRLSVYKNYYRTWLLRFRKDKKRERWWAFSF